MSETGTDTKISRMPFFHVGIVVNDIQAAMTELSGALGVRWREPNESRYPDWTIKVVYSVEGPPFLELIEGTTNGGPWDVSGGPRIDHIGYYSEDVLKDSEHLSQSGVPIDFDPSPFGKRGGYCYHCGPATGARIELVNIIRKAHHERPAD
jgi:hypothetical protein